MMPDDPINCAVCGEPVNMRELHTRYRYDVEDGGEVTGYMHEPCVPGGDIHAWMDQQPGRVPNRH